MCKQTANEVKYFQIICSQTREKDNLNAVFSLSREIDLTGTLHAVLVC